MPTLRDLRMMRNLKLQDVAAALNMTPSALSRLERGLTRPRQDSVAKLSKFYGFPLEQMQDFLLPQNVPNALAAASATQAEDPLTEDLSPLERIQLEAYKEGLLSSRKLEHAVRIPIIGETAAGFGSTAASGWTGDYVALPGDCMQGSNIRDFFALNVRGCSMEPRIMDGDIAVFRTQNDVNSGDIALVTYGDDVDAVGSYGTVKEVRKEPDGALSLVALNPEFETLTLRGEDLASVRIQGKLMQIIRTF